MKKRASQAWGSLTMLWLPTLRVMSHSLKTYRFRGLTRSICQRWVSTRGRSRAISFMKRRKRWQTWPMLTNRRAWLPWQRTKAILTTHQLRLMETTVELQSSWLWRDKLRIRRIRSRIGWALSQPILTSMDRSCSQRRSDNRATRQRLTQRSDARLESDVKWARKQMARATMRRTTRAAVTMQLHVSATCATFFDSLFT